MQNTFANYVIKNYQKKMNFVLTVDLKERKFMLEDNIKKIKIIKIGNC